MGLYSPSLLKSLNCASTRCRKALDGAAAQRAPSQNPSAFHLSLVGGEGPITLILNLVAQTLMRMAIPLKPHADPWHELAPLIWGLVALHVVALLYWIVQVLLSSKKAKPAEKEH